MLSVSGADWTGLPGAPTMPRLLATMEAANATDKNGEILRVNDLQVVAPYRELLAQNALESLDDLFDPTLGEALTKPGLEPWRERLRVKLDDNGITRVFFLKRFTKPPTKARRQAKSAGCGAKSVAGVEWGWMRRLAEVGVACTQPVAFGQEVVRGRERRSAVVSALVPGQSLESWARQWDAGDRDKFEGLLSPIAELVRALHKNGLVHRDLYLSHVFHDPTEPVERSLRLIDLQRVFRPQVIRTRWIVKDLAALNYSTPPRLVSTADRVRWLKKYLGLQKLSTDARKLLHRVVRKTARIARHDAKRNK